MSAPTRTWTSGDWSTLGTLYADLAMQDSVELALEPTVQPDVVVHVSVSGAALPAEIARIREYTSAPIVVLANAPGSELLDNAVADVLLLPQSGESVAFALARAARAAQEARTALGAGKLLTVFSPKGGSGKSVTATNLGALLGQSGVRTLLVDLDLQFGDAAIMLGLQPDRTLYDLVTAPGGLDGGKLRAFTVKHGSGLDVLAAPIRPEDAEEVSDAKVAELLDVAKAEYDYVIVDTAPFLYGPTLEAIDRTDSLVLLCVPDVPAMKNVRLAMQTLSLLSFDESNVHLVLNRANPKLGLRTGEAAQIMDRKVDFELPEDPLVTLAVNRATPLVQYRPRSPFAAAIDDVRMSISGLEVNIPVRRRFALGRSR